MKKYETVKLTIHTYSIDDVIRTSGGIGVSTTQGDFFDLSGFEGFGNAKEVGD